MKSQTQNFAILQIFHFLANLFTVKKSLKWGTVGFFSVSESKVIKQTKKKLKQEFAQFL
jgi:hypothetical protein